MKRYCEHGVNFWVTQNMENFTSQPGSSKTFKKDSPSWSYLCWVLTGPSSGSPSQASTSGVQNEGNHGSMPHMLVPPTWCERHICCSVTPIKMNVTLNYLCLKHMKLLKSNLLLTVSFNFFTYDFHNQHIQCSAVQYVYNVW